MVERFAGLAVKLSPRISLKSVSSVVRLLSESTLVILGTCAIFAAALGYILRFSVNDPFVDEWDLTQVILGGMTLSEWTFTRLNEHYFISGNAIWYVTMKASGLDFRAGMFVNLLLHLTASIVLMRSARRIRGWSSLADLAFPAVLLHWGHAYNLLMSYQIVFGCFTLSAAVMLWVVSTAVAGLEIRTAKRGVTALLVLMINGGMGLAFVPPLVIWIAILLLRRPVAPTRTVTDASPVEPDDARAGTRHLLSRIPFAISGLVLALTYTAYVLLGSPRVSAAPSEALSLTRVAWCTAQYFGIGTGLWIDGPHWPRNCTIVACIFAVLMIVLTSVTWRRCDGGRGAGFLFFLTGHFAVAIGIAVSRGGGLAERYVTISAVGVASALLAMLVLWDGRFTRRLLVAVAILSVASNFAPGESFGHRHRSLYRNFDKDLQAGMPIGFLRDKYQSRLRVGENLEPAIERLKVHHVRQFDYAIPTPPMNELPIANAEFDEVLTNPPGMVLGLVVEIEVKQSTPWSEMRLVTDGVSLEVYPPLTPGVYRLRFWINKSIQTAKLIEASQPHVLKLRSASWLVK